MLKNKSFLYLLIPLAFVIFGFLFFLSQWGYSENGHKALLISYMVGCAGLSAALKFKRKALITFIVIVLLAICAYAQAKFEWRKDYINSSRTLSQSFQMEPYIASYPTFEDHYLHFFMNNPRWVAFNDECFRPALFSGGAASECMSAARISDNYNIDIYNVIDDYYERMQWTANGMIKGHFDNKANLRTCLQNKKCAAIPLLPAEAQNINYNNLRPEYQKVSNQFWSIVEEDDISAENCNFVPLCRAMQQLGVIAIAPATEG